VNGETVFVRSVGLGGRDAASPDEAGTAPAEVTRVIRAYTPAGGRPEPVRVARLAARGAQAWRAGDADRHG
jgi:endonuclease V-like protein UPF0215 family